MRKDQLATATADEESEKKAVTGNFISINKMIMWFETRPLLATTSLLVLTLFLLFWNLQPYYYHLFQSTVTTSLTTSVTTSVNSHGNGNNVNNNVSSNKRVFVPYGNAASLFVLMGAYRGGPTSFSIVGLASKPIHVYGHPWFKCRWIPNTNSSSSNNSSSIESKAIQMLPDWGYGRVYTVVVLNCSFPVNPNPDNSGGKLLLYAYYGLSPDKYELIPAFEEQPGSYNGSKFHPPYDYDYLYCGSSLYGNLSALRIREWMAYHAWFFGSKSHFVFHDAGGVSPEVRLALEPWVRAGRATIQDIRDQSEYDGYYYNQFLVVNDCLHRYRFSSNWTFYFDVDEYIYLPDGRTLESVLDELSQYTQFTIEQNPMSSSLCINYSNAADYSKQWGFEKLVFRDSRTGIRRDRKYAIQAKNAYATGVHMSENVVGNTTHDTEGMIRYYHYHNSITVEGEPCREVVPVSAESNVTWFNEVPYVYDDNMTKLADTVKEFERKTLGGNPDMNNLLMN